MFMNFYSALQIIENKIIYENFCNILIDKLLKTLFCKIII